MMQHKLLVGGVEYAAAYNIRAMLVFERLAERAFAVRTLTDWTILLYACICSANVGAEPAFDTILDALTEAELQAAVAWMTERMNVNAQLNGDEQQQDGEKKS